MDYINRLNNYDISEIANITVGSELYEEALVIFEKAELLVDCISSIEPATKSAERIDKDKVCVILGKVQQLVNVELVYCLQMCHKTVEESHLDTSLILSYAKGEQVVSLEEIISATHPGRGREV